MRKLNIIESLIIVAGLIIFGIGNQVAVVQQNYPWVEYLGLVIVFITGLSDAIYRIVTKKSFFK
ncbi:hypothetical protein [Lactiplantibacillus plajomi]|uniref:Uncharacterized protein n=1 Tax=Lactiplantibacillus plajomi TaxID=1457217 RepID=A0ABV6K0N3_9LACO|nr:hypothetical protein [Lactiplantibacillus plajomi]